MYKACVSLINLYHILFVNAHYYITDEKIEGKTVTTIGWGYTGRNDSNTSRFLRETRAKVLERKVCKKMHAVFDDTMICAFGLEGEVCTVIILFNTS